MVNESKADPVVCIIDDDLAVRESLAALLDALDLRVACFSTAEEFLARPADVVPSLLIVDVRLPGMSGLELLAQMAGGNITPTSVVMTAHADAHEMQLDFWPTEICILSKPCRPEKLIEMIPKSR